MEFADEMFALSENFQAEASTVSSDESDFHTENRFALGARRSFVPILGDITWCVPEEAADDFPFYGYTCETEDRRKIGYVRVGRYAHSKKAVEQFGDLVARYERTTDVMVLDQVNNPGGSLFHMYAMLSYLTPNALLLPKHEIIISEQDLALARHKISIAESHRGDRFDDLLSSEELGYHRFVLTEYNAGRGVGKISNRVHLLGVSKVLPAKNHYTKRIVVLTNELDFSAPEFLAAILQDNARATLFGRRTAGAGGCVRKVVSNELGIDYATLTWTVAYRTNGQRIEGIGIDPDVPYSPTVDDLQSGFPGYRRALLETINSAQIA